MSLLLDDGSGVEAVSDQNIEFEDVEKYSFENDDWRNIMHLKVKQKKIG